MLYVVLCAPLQAQTNGQPYLCEFGLQGGFGYYVGDANPHIFINPREAFGLQFRYKFTKRWALQVKAASQRITGHEYTYEKGDKRIKPYTPYIFLGIGAGIYGAEGYTNGNFRKVAAYFPFGIGFKWKFHDRVGLNIAWQHNVYFADDLENRENLADRYDMNGSNVMNCDLTGMFTVGIVFEFAQAKKECRICNW